MMPTVNIPDALFKRLQKHGEPLIDDVTSVVTKLVDFFEANAGSSATAANEVVKSYAADNPPDLKFTSPQRIVLNGETFTEKSKIYWNPLLFEVVRLAGAKLDKATLKKHLIVNHVDGVGMAEKGYRHIPEAGVSVQGQDANNAWTAIRKLVTGANLSLEVEFQWQDTPGAAHPGKRGKFEVSAK